MSVIKIDADLFLDDFEAEARAHIEKIEASFLDVGSLVGDPALMNSVFRTAHSLKGTAGFFSLDKIVSVAHELESVFSQIKDGKLEISDEITDVVLQSVDCLRDLVDNLRNDESIDTSGILETLKVFSAPATAPAPSGPGADQKLIEINTPFDCADPETQAMLKNAAKHGHKIYYVNISFNRGLGNYYKHPSEMLDNIQSIGSIVESIVDGRSDEIIRGKDSSAFTERIIHALTERDTTTLELLVTSVLEFDLFSIAIEISKKNIFPLSRESVFGTINCDKILITDITSEVPQDDETEDGSDVTTNAPSDAGTDAGSMAASMAASMSASMSASSATPVTAVPVTTGAAKHDPDMSSMQSRPWPQSKTQSQTPGQSQPQPQTQGGNFLIHLDISIINSLLDLANEMVLARNQLLSATSEYKKSISGLTPILQDMNRLTSEIQEKVMLTRMQPINVIFNKFPRIIRDTAKALKKDIEIEIIGGDVTLDKYLLDALTDPITQLVKNSADHGVESVERRIELGKPLKGKITLNTYMRDGSAVIEVLDDGAGINVDAVKEKALERGIVTEEMLPMMSDSDAFALIFEPGFSTAKQVTNLSGRGVGMDIVKTNVEKLGGSIEVESETGVGSTVRLRMPLTLSVVRALIVVIDSIQYAVPELNVERIVRIGRAMASRCLERVNDSLVLVLGERVVPLVTMREINAKARGLTMPSTAEILEECLKRDVIKCLILKAGDRNFALLIDDANDTEQTLVKPLPKFFKNCLCYSSVTVLGNGSAITILDAEGILRLLGIKGAQKESQHIEREEENKDDIKQYILFKCSGTELFALETSEISRIENIDTKSIQEIGQGRFINIADETIQIVRPESFTPVKKKQYPGEKLYLLTLKNSATPIGLLAGKVLDKVEAAFKYDNDRLVSDFIFGTSTYNEKIIIFLNPAAIAGEVEMEKHRKKNNRKAGAVV